MSSPPNATLGGQAVIEGVMMRAPSAWAVAVRRPDGTIASVSHALPRLSSRSRLARIPFVRGVMVLGESLTLGFRSLSWSARMALDEDEKPLTSSQLAVSMTVALVAFAALFIMLPLGAARLAERYLGDSSILFNLVDGFVRVGLFIGYIWAIGRSAEIRRVFQYHGAEHKTVHAYESGDPLTTDRIQQYRPEHPRCGTGFLMTVVIISLLVFTLIGRPGWPLLIASRLVLIPVIAGLAYETMKFAAARGGERLGRILSAPGLWLQRLTTGEPDDQQVEVAVTSLLAALEDRAVEEVKARGPICPAALAALAAE